MTKGIMDEGHVEVMFGVDITTVIVVYGVHVVEVHRYEATGSFNSNLPTVLSFL